MYSFSLWVYLVTSAIVLLLALWLLFKPGKRTLAAVGLIFTLWQCIVFKYLLPELWFAILIVLVNVGVACYLLLVTIKKKPALFATNED
jgi:predicted membrane protein